MSTLWWTGIFIFQHVNTFKSHSRSDVRRIIIILTLLGKEGPKPKLGHRENNCVLEPNSPQIAILGLEPRRANAPAVPLPAAPACFTVRAGGKGRAWTGHGTTERL